MKRQHLLKTAMNICFFFFLFFTVTHSLCLWFISFVVPEGRRLLLPRARRLFKVDSSSRWVTNAGPQTWPSKREEGTTKYTSFLQSEKLRNAHRREIHWHTNMAFSQLIIYIISSKITAELKEKSKAEVYRLKHRNTLICVMVITVFQRVANDTNTRHERKKRCKAESYKWANYCGLQVLQWDIVYFMCLEEEQELICLVNKNEGITIMESGRKNARKLVKVADSLKSFFFPLFFSIFLCKLSALQRVLPVSREPASFCLRRRVPLLGASRVN